MRRSRRPWVVLAVALAVLLPLEQAHCLWMGLQTHAPVSAPMTQDHSCCAPTSPERPSPASAPACTCIQLPAGTVPHVAVTPVPATSTAALLTAVLAAPAAILGAPAPTLDVGSPPLPLDLGAHGLRAPPLSV